MSPRPPETRSVLASPRPAPRSPATSRAAMRNRRYPARRSPRRPMPHPPPRHRVDPTHAFRPPVRSTPITPVPIVAGRPTGDPLSPPRTSREPAPASQPSLTLCDHPTGGTPSPLRHRRPGRCSGCAPGTQRRAGRCPRRPSARDAGRGAAPGAGVPTAETCARRRVSSETVAACTVASIVAWIRCAWRSIGPSRCGCPGTAVMADEAVGTNSAPSGGVQVPVMGGNRQLPSGTAGPGM